MIVHEAIILLWSPRTEELGGFADGAEYPLEVHPKQSGLPHQYVILQPPKSKIDNEVADCLVSIFFNHGPTRILHMDNSTEFSNKTHGKY